MYYVIRYDWLMNKTAVNLTIRIPAEQHRRIKMVAAERGVSIRRLLEPTLSKLAAPDEPRPTDRKDAT